MLKSTARAYLRTHHKDMDVRRKHHGIPWQYVHTVCTRLFSPPTKEAGDEASAYECVCLLGRQPSHNHSIHVPQSMCYIAQSPYTRKLGHIMDPDNESGDAVCVGRSCHIQTLVET